MASNDLHHPRRLTLNTTPLCDKENGSNLTRDDLIEAPYERAVRLQPVTITSHGYFFTLSLHSVGLPGFRLWGKGPHRQPEWQLVLELRKRVQGCQMHQHQTCLSRDNPNQIQTCECCHSGAGGAPLTPGIHCTVTIRAQMSHYKLWCYVAGGFSYFAVNIDPSKFLDDLKEQILNKQKNRLSGVDGDGLMLFQVCHPGVPCSH